MRLSFQGLTAEEYLTICNGRHSNSIRVLCIVEITAPIIAEISTDCDTMSLLIINTRQYQVSPFW